MALDELIEALRNIREHVPGDTPVVYCDLYAANEFMEEKWCKIEEVGFFPEPPEGEQQRVTIR